MPSSTVAKSSTKLRLADYTPPVYLTPETHLTFDIRSLSKVQVRVSLAVQHNIESGVSAGSPLVLNCNEHIQLQSVRIHDAEIEYTREEETLTIKNVPEGDFTLTIDHTINPESNKSGKGVYVSGGSLVTQCEPHGFQWIAPSIDRPDNMGIFTVTIIADKKRFPVLLSNGNVTPSPVSPVKGSGPHGALRPPSREGSHVVTYHDPFRKPTYLFALTAGDLDVIENTYTTTSGKDVKLRIFSEKGEIKQCHHAMESLKKSMQWDEDRFGLECDLHEFKIVVVHDFNSGAMENKGLNIFNSSCAYADPKSATDDDFEYVERVIAHEYFHNWTGDRVTCRDWFQLTLKEGLTVFRDEEFTSDLHSRPLKRIDDARVINIAQFAEDAGPNAHPIRPQEVETIDNFYTATVYNKGAEVIRMMFTMMGKEKFREALSLYLSRHDGEAVTTDEFIDAMQEVSAMDLTQFRNTWYEQKGTPMLKAKGEYNAAKKTYTLHLEQTPAHADQKPFHFPVELGLIGEDGQEIPLQVKGRDDDDESTWEKGILHMRKKQQSIVFEHVTSQPTLSLLRNFSAPVKLQLEQSPEELRHLMQYDCNLYNRYAAAQRYGKIILRRLIADQQAKKALWVDLQDLEAYGSILDSVNDDPDFAARMFALPSLREMVQDMDVYDYDNAFVAREFMIQSIAETYEDQLLTIYDKYHSTGEYSLDAKDIAARRIKNVCLAYLSKLPSLEGGAHVSLLMKQFHEANNMTDQEFAFRLLCDEQGPQRDETIASFYKQWKHHKLVFCKWVEGQALSRRDDIMERIAEIEKIPEFDNQNPNTIRALYSYFAAANKLAFHHVSGAGYRFLADHVIRVDGFNPQMAAGLCKRFDEYKKMDAARRALIKTELLRIQKKTSTKNVQEIVRNILGE